MNERKYTAKYFKDSMPEWKRKKDPMIVRCLYRQISFWLSSICANCKIKANTVSYLTIIVSFAACACFYFNSYYLHLTGVLLVNLWLICDCVDGNIARVVKKQPFGVFADATACYLLLAFLYISIGYALYLDGGVLFSRGSVWVVVIGSLTSSADIVMRLIFHKFREGEIELNKIINKQDQWLDVYKPHFPSRKDRLKEATGIGGYQPMILLITFFFNAMDVYLVGCFVMEVIGLIFYTAKSISKAVKLSNEYEDIYNDKWLNA